jgi:hypothetical protein
MGKKGFWTASYSYSAFLWTAKPEGGGRWTGNTY